MEIGSQISGIQVTSELKILGMKISTDKKQIVAEAKSACKRNMAILKGKIKTANADVSRIL